MRLLGISGWTVVPYTAETLGVVASKASNFAVEQTAGSHSLARGCSPQRWAAAFRTALKVLIRYRGLPLVAHASTKSTS